MTLQTKYVTLDEFDEDLGLVELNKVVEDINIIIDKERSAF